MYVSSGEPTVPHVSYELKKTTSLKPASTPEVIKRHLYTVTNVIYRREQGGRLPVPMHGAAVRTLPAHMLDNSAKTLALIADKVIANVLRRYNVLSSN